MQPNYRRCVSCRKVANRQHLLRIVRTYPTGAVQVDHGMGRSAYLCPQPSCLHLAQRKNRLGRALKVAIPETIYRLLNQKISQQMNPRLPSKTFS